MKNLLKNLSDTSKHAYDKLKFSFYLNSPTSILIQESDKIKFIKGYNYLNVDFMENQILDVTIYDLNGRVLYKDKTYNQKQIEIDLLYFRKGFYIISCNLKNERINHKFIID